jgi:integrase
MAQVYRPTYTDPRTGQRKRSKTWHIRYYTPDGVRHHRKGFRDKRATENLAAELERRGIHEAAGVIDPTHEHAKIPLAEHLADYITYLRAKGDTPRHVRQVETYTRACLDSCRFVRVGDVQPSAVLTFLAALRDNGKGITTANFYLTAAKGFTRWLWKDRRIGSDPLAGVSKLANAAADVRRARRDLSPEEVGWLASETLASAKSFRTLTGPDRRLLYLTAAGTGFRVSELAALEPHDFNLDSEPPTVIVKAGYAKNGQTATQPMAATRGPVWPGTWADRAAKMLDRDLTTARGRWLESFQDDRQRGEAERSDFLAYCDSEGRYADFHALRHTYISRIVQSGASAKTAQTLARHSTVQLTLGRYAHASLMDLSAAVSALPPIDPAGPDAEQQALAATGTDGAGMHQEPLMQLCPNLCPQPAKTGDFLRLAETEEAAPDRSPDGSKTPEKDGFAADSRGKELSALPRTRTGNPLIKSQLLCQLS